MGRWNFEPPATNRTHRLAAISLSVIVLIAGVAALNFLRGGFRVGGHGTHIVAVALLAVAYIALRIRMTVSRRRAPSAQPLSRSPRRRPRFPSAPPD